MSSTEIRHGSCLCKAVKYEVKGDPFTFYVCHCVNCRKFTGTAFMSNCFFAPENVVITQGNDTIKTYRDTDTATGKALNRSFCPNCGSGVFMSNDENNFKIVCAGTIDGDIPWMPKKQVFEDSKRPWVEGIKTLPKAVTKQRL